MPDSSVYPPASSSGLKPSTVLISVKGDVYPGYIPRVLEQFAKRIVVPEKITCGMRRAKKGSTQSIRIWITDVDDHTTGHIGRYLAQIPGTVCVEIGGVAV